MMWWLLPRLKHSSICSGPVHLASASKPAQTKTRSVMATERYRSYLRTQPSVCLFVFPSHLIKIIHFPALFLGRTLIPNPNFNFFSMYNYLEWADTLLGKIWRKSYLHWKQGTRRVGTETSERRLNKRASCRQMQQLVHMESHTPCGLCAAGDKWRDMALITREKSLCNVVLKLREAAMSTF